MSELKIQIETARRIHSVYVFEELPGSEVKEYTIEANGEISAQVVSATCSIPKPFMVVPAIMFQEILTAFADYAQAIGVPLKTKAFQDGKIESLEKQQEQLNAWITTVIGNSGKIVKL